MEVYETKNLIRPEGRGVEYIVTGNKQPLLSRANKI